MITPKAHRTIPQQPSPPQRTLFPMLNLFHPTAYPYTTSPLILRCLCWELQIVAPHEGQVAHSDRYRPRTRQKMRPTHSHLPPTRDVGRRERAEIRIQSLGRGKDICCSDPPRKMSDKRGFHPESNGPLVHRIQELVSPRVALGPENPGTRWDD